MGTEPRLEYWSPTVETEDEMSSILDIKATGAEPLLLANP